MHRSTFIDNVRLRSNVTGPDLVDAGIEATLITLGELISSDQAAELAAELPPGLEGLGEHRDRASFDRTELTKRVQQRSGLTADDASRLAEAVFASIAESVSCERASAVREQLPDDLAAMLTVSGADPAEQPAQSPLDGGACSQHSDDL
jgi:uncharacterized protein (DUF2267 family)